MSCERTFSTLRQEWEFFSFSLVLRDENKNVCRSVSCFEKRARISVFQYSASRRERESRLRQFLREFLRMKFVTCFCLGLIFSKKAVNVNVSNFLNLVCNFSLSINWNQTLIFRDENENIFPSISCVKTRSKIFFYQSHVSR